MTHWKSFSSQGGESSYKALPDFVYLSKELTKKGVTLQLLHEEYKKEHPDGYERSRFFASTTTGSKKPIGDALYS